MRNPIRRLGPAVLLLALVSLLSGCGGGGTDANVEKLLDRAFKKSIDSADIKLNATIDLKGSGLGRPLQIRATGPFRNLKDKLPAADIRLQLGGPAETGFVSTGDRVFFKFGDVFYEQPRSAINDALEDIRSNSADEGSLQGLGLDPRRWLADSEQKDDEEVAGVDTEHVGGELDIGAVVKDFNDFVKRSAGSLPGVGGLPVPDPLTEDQIKTIEDVVDDPSFDVFVGKDDDIIRRLSGSVEFDVPEDERSNFSGLEGGSINFSIEFADVNGDQRIEAPANARPLSDLERSLGELGELGSDQDDPRVRDCVEKTDPGNTDALQRCYDLAR